MIVLDQEIFTFSRNLNNPCRTRHDDRRSRISSFFDGGFFRRRCRRLNLGCVGGGGGGGVVGITRGKSGSGFLL